jgi:lysozyme
VTRNQRITEAQADLFLEQDVRWALDTVKAAGVELTQNELDALVSFVYNVGMAAFNRSTMRALLQAGKPRDEVAKEFLRWNKAGGRVLSGLTARRLAEQQLFMRSN